MTDLVEVNHRNISLSVDSLKPKSRIKIRWIVFFIAAVQTFTLVSIKISMSLTVVAMISDVTCSVDNTTGIMSKGCLESDTHRKYHINWTDEQKSRLLQAFIWGSMGMAIFGGRIAEIYGPRRVASSAVLMTGLINLSFPWIARKSFWFSYFVRLAQGICSAIATPTSQVILSRWAPQQEKTIANSIIVSGALFSNAITHPLVGLMVSGDLLGGWPIVFYILGLLCVVIAVILFILVRDDPGQHPFISQDELVEILQHRLVRKGKAQTLPWKSLLTSPAIYAVLTANFCYSWSAGFFSLQLSSFYKDVLRVSYKSNGVMTALPYIVSILVNYTAGYLVDWLRSSEILTTIRLRKICTLIGYGVAAGSLFLIPSVGPHVGTVVILATIAKAFGALNVAGPGSNHLDICPSFVGTFNGISRTVQDLSQILMNESVAWLVGNNPTSERWYSTFYLSAFLVIIGATTFILLGSGNVQRWDPAYRKPDDHQSMGSSKSRTKVKEEEKY